MGWLEHLDNKVKLVSNPGVFDLSAIQALPEESLFPLMIKLPGTSSTNFYLSLRNPEDLDSSIQSTYSKGVNIHAFSGYGKTRFIASLTDGAKFTDSRSGLQVEQLSKALDGSSARVAISYACLANPIKLSMSPLSQSVSSGSLASYRLTVMNQDSPGCSSSTFRLNLQKDAQLALSNFSHSEFVLQPGSSQVIDFAISTQETSGTFYFSLTASDIDGMTPNHSDGSIQGSLSVQSVQAPKKGKGGGGDDSSSGTGKGGRRVK